MLQCVSGEATETVATGPHPEPHQPFSGGPLAETLPAAAKEDDKKGLVKILGGTLENVLKGVNSVL